MMPIPTHLQGLVVPMDDSSNEESLDAMVRCPCHSESFEFLYPGDTKEHNGVAIPVTAERGGGKCGSVPHGGRISVYGEGKDDFVESAADFPPDRWPDGFGWFFLSLACKSCGSEIDHWIDYETM
jgi:hypothetical protein